MLLADCGTDPNDTTLFPRQTALELAVTRGNEVSTEYLLQYGADPRPFMEPWPYGPGLHQLTFERRLDMVQSNQLVMAALGPLATLDA